MKNLYFCILFLLFFHSITPLFAQKIKLNRANKAQEVLFEDFVYESEIKTVLLYPFYNSNFDLLRPAVLGLEQSAPMILEFDDVGRPFSNYYVKIYHCNSNWEKSNLGDIQFLNDYNEFPIQGYNYSINTYQGYIHYKYILPKLKLPGNYLLIVSRDANWDSPAITKKFMVYENQVFINSNVKFTNIVSQRTKAQQVDFTINHSQLDLPNPQDVYVVVRQNQRWDNAIKGLPPLYIKRDESSLDYQYFDGENNFWGGNEFRPLDLRSTRFARTQVMAIENKNGKGFEMQLDIDRSRGTELYTQIIDINGKFLIDRYETGNGSVESDYVSTNFRLDVPAKEGENIYIVGAFNNYAKNESSLMQYNVDKKYFESKQMLKQGYYNYLYVSENPNSKQTDYVSLESTFSNTENLYEIFVYYRPPGTFYDLLIGYKSINYPQ